MLLIISTALGVSECTQIVSQPTSISLPIVLVTFFSDKARKTLSVAILASYFAFFPFAITNFPFSS